MIDFEHRFGRLLTMYGRAMMENQEKDERIAELEAAVARLSDEKAILISARQNEVETARQPHDPITNSFPAQDGAPIEPFTEQPATVRIIRSRTPKGENPALA